MFIRKIPKQIKKVEVENGNEKLTIVQNEATSKDLEDHFKNFGGIISCKVSLEQKNHESRGYGFVCFQDSEYAKAALEATKGHESYVGV